ncbi:MAG: flavodoxin family protein [Defluviitaleaceae bacterium]|nr:flavodoxin family protein [Defluviitaleaceae bacterium]
MKVLVVNGSPKGEKSATIHLTRAFLEGAGWTDAEVIDISKSNVKGCNGCYSCWEKTPGKCVINDDMTGFLPKLIEADVVITSFPLYGCFFPGQLKCFMDRMLPIALPFMDKDAENGGHPLRHDLSKQRQFYISTCGFWTADGNYDSIIKLFERGNVDINHKAFTIFCGQGGLFGEAEADEYTKPYLDTVRKAGSEFAAGEISEETQTLLSQTILPREVYEKAADESWDV